VERSCARAVEDVVCTAASSKLLIYPPSFDAQEHRIVRRC